MGMFQSTGYNELAIRQYLYCRNRFEKMCSRHGLDPKDNKMTVFVDRLGYFRVGINRPFVRFYKTNI